MGLNTTKQRARIYLFSDWHPILLWDRLNQGFDNKSGGRICPEVPENAAIPVSITSCCAAPTNSESKGDESICISNWHPILLWVWLSQGFDNKSGGRICPEAPENAAIPASITSCCAAPTNSGFFMMIWITRLSWKDWGRTGEVQGTERFPTLRLVPYAKSPAPAATGRQGKWAHRKDHAEAGYLVRLPLQSPLWAKRSPVWGSV